jgi:putative transposase
MKLRKQSHCVYQCEYPIVLATKYRRKIFNKGIFAYMLERLKELRDHYPEIDILETNHDKGYVHMLVSIPPKMSVGKLLG